MLKELEDFLAPREERVKFGKVDLIVRELDGSADNSALKSGEEDVSWRILVRCVFLAETGELAFTEADIPKLKRKSPVFVAPLVNACNRVNGFDSEEEVKNSDAAQS